jgi:hypothetical protein
MVFYRGEAKKGKRRENVITKMTCDALWGNLMVPIFTLQNCQKFTRSCFVKYQRRSIFFFSIHLDDKKRKTVIYIRSFDLTPTLCGFHCTFRGNEHINLFSFYLSHVQKELKKISSIQTN